VAERGDSLVSSLINQISKLPTIVMAGTGFLILYLAVLFGRDDPFIFLVLVGIALYLFAISAKMYFANFRAPDVIPERDREFLVDIIKANGKDGIDTYIKLSSLYGFTGNITKLGLSGLPLLTVALTVFFTSLAVLLVSLGLAAGNENIVNGIMDLAKLTLGAFIGSFVQRSVSAAAAAANTAIEQAKGVR
jgi:hypothetical protein